MSHHIMLTVIIEFINCPKEVKMSDLVEQVRRQAAFIKELESSLSELQSGKAAHASCNFPLGEDQPTEKSKEMLSQPNNTTPWASASPKLKVVFGVRLPEATHIKLSWLADHTPNNSMHSIVLDAIESQVAKMLSEHYKG